MKKILPLIFLLIFGAFFLGYLYASKKSLTTEFVETNSNVLSRSFVERYSLYKMVRQGRSDRLEKTLEALIFGDIVAMKEIDFANTSNAELLCVSLKELSDVAGDEVAFSSELSGLLKSCK